MVKRSTYRGQPRLRWVEPRRITWARWQAVRGEHARMLIRGSATGVVLCTPIIVLAIWLVPGTWNELRLMWSRIAVYAPMMLGITALPLLLGGVVEVLVGREADIRANRIVVAGRIMPAKRLDWIGLRTDHPLGPWLAARTREVWPYQEMRSNVFLDPSVSVGELARTIAECTGTSLEIIEEAPVGATQPGCRSPWSYPPRI